MKPYSILIALFLLLVSTNGNSQNNDQNIYADSCGQIFIQVSSPIYFFISAENNTSEKTLIPSPDEKANPMYFDGEGKHFFQYVNNGKRIKYMIIADGTAPTPSIKTETNLLFARKTRIYADNNATFNSIAKDKNAGVKGIYTSINGEAFRQIEEPYSLPKQGENLVKVFAVDNVGNTSDTTTYSIIIAPEVIFKVDNIHFETASSRILEESDSSLSEIVEIMNNYTELILQIEAHADTRGNSESNLVLSQKRGATVTNYLVNHGINPKRLKSIGYGDSHPINECVKGVKCSNDQHKTNRRVEFRFTLPK